MSAGAIKSFLPLKSGRHFKMNVTLKEIVKNNEVQFSHYRAGHLYYHVSVADGDYSFPVPITDIGDATFLNKDKAIIMMRYIRKALDDGTLVRAT